MDAGVAALFGAGIGATAGVAGPIVAAWMARKAERQAWERTQRAELYTDMLTWAHQLERWTKAEAQLPLPNSPSEALTARAEFLAHARVAVAWNQLMVDYNQLQEDGIDMADASDLPGITAEAVSGSVDRLVEAIRADRLLPYSF